MERLAFRTCNVCEAMCGLVVEVDGDRIGAIRPDPDDVFSRGHVCPKGPAMREVHEDADRLRRPHRRTPEGFRPIGWDEAFDEVATKLVDVQKRHGRDAVAVYVGNPTVHAHGSVLFAPLFGAALATKNRFDANSQDANPKLYAALEMYGDLTSLTVPDVDRTHLLLMLGANPLASNGSVMSLGDVRGRLRGIRERGGRIVLVDPRRTESAALADEHLFIRPGGDAALLFSLLHVLFAERLVDERRASDVAKGLGALRDLAQPFAPERVGPVIGIDADAIRDLARAFAAAPSAVAYGRVGVCHGPFSAVASWLIEALNVVTGNFDREGGAMFARPAIELAPLARMLGVSGSGRHRSRVRGLPELGGMLPAATLAEEMETEGPGRIRALVTFAGNPVLSVPNGPRLARALEQLEFMASIDMYVNETTRHAHVVLPPCSTLERGHYDLVFHAIAVRNTVKYSEAVVPRASDALDDADILRELALRIVARRAGGGVERAAAALRGLARMDVDRVLDVLLRFGPYGDRFGLRAGLNLAKVRAAPHGIDLGPLVPMRHERVRTPDGRVDLAPAALVSDVPRLREWLSAAAPKLVLIGRRHLRSNNSWMHNVLSLTKGPSRSALLVHPSDAERLGLRTGVTAVVTSRVGRVEARVEVTPDVMPGVVSLPHGFGHAAERETLRIASTVDGPNANALTDDAVVEPLTGTAVLTGVPVSVEAAPS